MGSRFVAGSRSRAIARWGAILVLVAPIAWVTPPAAAAPEADPKRVCDSTRPQVPVATPSGSAFVASTQFLATSPLLTLQPGGSASSATVTFARNVVNSNAKDIELRLARYLGATDVPRAMTSTESSIDLISKERVRWYTGYEGRDGQSLTVSNVPIRNAGIKVMKYIYLFANQVFRPVPTIVTYWVNVGRPGQPCFIKRSVEVQPRFVGIVMTGWYQCHSGSFWDGGAAARAVVRLADARCSAGG